MELNPYQAPQEDPTPTPEQGGVVLTSRQRATAWLLSLLIVPAAAIAGFGTCTGITRASVSLLPQPLVDVGVFLSLPLGLAVAFGLQMLTVRWLMRSIDQRQPNWWRAILGAAMVTPGAIAAAVVLFMVFYSYEGKLEPSGAIYTLVAAIPGGSAMLVWCAGFWIGLRFRTGRRKESVERL